MSPIARAAQPAMLESPWFSSVSDILARLPADRFSDLEALNALAREREVATGGGLPLRFVPAANSAGDRKRQYELRIFDRGEVETRGESWHDFFNALVWLAFPRTKATLNRLHRDEILRRAGEGSSARGTARDVLTLFDEGGMIVACGDPSLAALLRDFRWKALFCARRADVVAHMRFFVFGHAILEHALAPHKAVTAKTLIIDVDRATLQWPAERLVALLDARAAAHFERPEALASTRALHPLPVLGIPGFTADNEDPSYYDDEAVFRAGRTRREAGIT